MRRYKYRAKDKKTGKAVSGSVRAENERAAGKILVDQGYVPQKLVEDETTGWFAKLTDKVTAKQRIIFTRQFATLIGAGLQIGRAHV